MLLALDEKWAPALRETVSALTTGESGHWLPSTLSKLSAWRN